VPPRVRSYAAPGGPADVEVPELSGPDATPPRPGAP